MCCNSHLNCKTCTIPPPSYEAIHCTGRIPDPIRCSEVTRGWGLSHAMPRCECRSVSHKPRFSPTFWSQLWNKKSIFFSQKVCNRIADGEFEFELEIHLNSINQKHLVPSSRFLFLIETDSNWYWSYFIIFWALGWHLSTKGSNAKSILPQAGNKWIWMLWGENRGKWKNILSGCQVCDWGIQYHLCSTYRGLWGLVVVRLSLKGINCSSNFKA